MSLIFFDNSHKEWVSLSIFRLYFHHTRLFCNRCLPSSAGVGKCIELYTIKLVSTTTATTTTTTTTTQCISTHYKLNELDQLHIVSTNVKVYILIFQCHVCCFMKLWTILIHLDPKIGNTMSSGLV